MAKIPTTLGELNTPQARRGVASYDVSSVRAGMLGAARSTKAGLDDLARGAKTLAVAAENVQAEDDRRYAVELENEFAKRIAAIQYGDGTAANPGYFNLQGEQAVSGYAGTEQSIERAKQELLQKAKNRRVRDTFKLAADRRQVTETEQMRSHVGKARIDAANTASETRFTQAMEDASAAPGNTEILNRSLAIVENEAIAMGKRNGWNNETIALKISDARTGVLAGVVQAAIVSDPEAADVIYQANKHKINASSRAKLEGLLLEQTMDSIAQKGAEEIMATVKGEAAQLQAARDLYGGKKEEAIVKELKTRYQEVEERVNRAYTIEERARAKIRFDAWQKAEAEEQGRKDAKKAGLDAVEGGMTVADFAKANPDQYMAMTIEDIAKLEKREVAIKTGKEYSNFTDPVVKTELWQMKPGALADLNPLEYKDKMTEGDYEQFLKFRDAQIDRLNKESANQGYYTRMEYMLKDYAPKFGPVGKQKLAIDDKVLDAAKNQAASEIYEAIRNDVKVDDKFLREQANRLMMPLWKEGGVTSFWKDSLAGVIGNYDDMDKSEQDSVYIPKVNIDPAMYTDIEAALKAKGKEPDEVLIGKIALALIRQDEARYNQLMGQ